MGASYTKLHWNILSEDWTNVLKRIEKCPQELRIANTHGNLPLHFACYSGNAPTRVIRALVENYPESVNIQNNKRYNPLILARKNYNTENMDRRNEVIAFLMSRMEGNTDSVPATTNQQKAYIDSSIEYEPTFKTEQCVVCLSDSIEYSCFPCGHACLCRNCANSMVSDERNNNTCPICRSHLEKIIKLRVMESSIQSLPGPKNIEISPTFQKLEGQA